MAYIIGARCTDGVVLISDRKTMRGTTASYKEKLMPVLRNGIVGGAGSIGLIDILSDEITKQVNTKQITELYQLLKFIEDKSLELSERYEYRIGGFGVLIGIRVTNESQLYNIVTNSGFAEPVKEYISIGSGEPHGTFLLKYLWDKDMNMMDFANLGYFSIKYVTNFGLDDGVGGDPIMWFIPDVVEEAKNEEEFIKIQQKYESRQSSQNDIEKMKVYSKVRLEMVERFIVTMDDEQSIIDICNAIDINKNV